MLLHLSHRPQLQACLIRYIAINVTCVTVQKSRNLIICAPKIKALAENFETVKLMVGGEPLYPPPGSVPAKRVRTNRMIIAN